VKRARKFAVLVASAICAFALFSTSSASAATFTVSKGNDTNDGTCNADCSLREAIVAANATPAADTIVLGARTHTLSIAGPDEELAATGDLDLADESVAGKLTIRGAGTSASVVDGAGLDRVFDCRDCDAELTGLTITGGDARASAVAAERHGGGIRVIDQRVVLEDVLIEGNGAANGGGASVAGTANPRLIGNRVTFNQNTAFGDAFGGTGGAIYNGGEEPLGDDGQVVLVDSAVSNNASIGANSRAGGIASEDDGHVSLTGVDVSGNTANGDGGGINNRDESSLALEDTTIRNNLAERGGGLFNQNHGHTDADRIEISGNEASGDGGGIFNQNDSTLTIRQSTIDSNTSAVTGGGIFARNSSVVTLIESSVTGNSATSAADDGGGGIHAQQLTTISLMRSTVSDNSSAASGGGISTTDDDVRLLLENSTVSGNDAAIGGGGIATAGNAETRIRQATIAFNNAQVGGGILNATTSGQGVLARGSLISSNTAPTGPNCFGALISQGNNLDGGNGCGLAAGTDIANGNAALAPLAANGGPTQTHALGVGSDALDSAASDCGLGIDQRRVSRPQGPACDIGAFEAVPDVTAPVLTLTAPSPQKAGKPIKAEVTCDEACTVALSGSVKVKPKKKGKTVKAKLKPKSVAAGGGDPVKVRLKLKGKRSSKAVMRAVKQGGKGTFSVKGRAADPSGNTTSERVKGKLK
jgi:CSLREA domain-containing protein